MLPDGSMFTKAAGVFLQLLGGLAVFMGVASLTKDGVNPFGVVAILVGVGLMWLGRRTRKT